MSESVSRLDSWLFRHRPTYYARLLPGLSDGEWSAFESRLGLRLPNGLRVRIYASLDYPAETDRPVPEATVVSA